MVLLLFVTASVFLQDGVVVVWHDQSIEAEKCQDTAPVVMNDVLCPCPLTYCYTQFEGDPDFPYVGKFIVNLTLAQIKTLDCGSKRLDGFRRFFASMGERRMFLTTLHCSASAYIPRN